MPHTSATTSRQITLAHLICLICLLALAPLAHAGKAAVAMPDRYSASAAEAVLQRGGNAVDAAVAAALVLAVTYPEAGNIGGGGFMLVHMDGDSAFLDFRERAPAAATRDMYLDEQGNFLERDALVGGLASGVPGTVRGLKAAHERYGRLPWASLVAPATTLARDGFSVHTHLAAAAAESSEFLAGQTNFEAYFGKLKYEDTFRQPELADTLARIAEDPEDFYLGRTADLLVAQMKRSGGLITRADLAAYQPVWRPPAQVPWREFTVVSAPPPSSGGVALGQLLQMRDHLDEYFVGVEHNSAQYVHLLAELEKRVFADRAAYLGDPDFVDNPLARLLSADYARRRAAGINPGEISSAAEVPPGLESPDTTHLSVSDEHGNAVALTFTLNWEFGSGVVVAGAGFVLNNEMDDFAAAPGTVNKFGVTGSEANAIAPGKRMLSSMTPTILLRDGEASIVLGSPGGSTIFTSVFQVLLNLLDHGMTPQNAVDALRFHHQLPEDRLIRHDQRAIPEATRTGLERMGYTVEQNSWGNLGDVQFLLIDGGQATGAADNRGRGIAYAVED